MIQVCLSLHTNALKKNHESSFFLPLAMGKLKDRQGSLAMVCSIYLHAQQTCPKSDNQKSPETYIKVYFIIRIFGSLVKRKIGKNSERRIISIYKKELKIFVFEKFVYTVLKCVII